MIEELKTIEQKQNEAYSGKRNDDPAIDESITHIKENYSKLLQGIEIILFLS